MTDAEFESRCLQFEEAWARGRPRPIADFLREPPLASSTDRDRLLAELIAIDLEFRWRAARDAVGPAGRLRLEDYAAMLPELGPRERWPLELIGEEYRVRRRWDDRPSHEEYLAPFSDRREEVQAELRRIDRELDEESSGPRAGGMLLPSSDLPEEIPGLPSFSHHDLHLHRLIGAGRTGKVFRAWDHRTRREVAVKFLRKTLLREPAVVRRFIEEARTVAGLSHHRIVGIQGIGRTPGGSCFLVMDLVEGPDLARVARARTIAVPEALRWTFEACEALSHAHEEGVIHCDLKPANLLLDGSGRIRVADFGLARSLGGTTPWAAEVEGTAPFMAPEQAARCWGRIDRRTDVYGIGAVLFALLTGRPPHTGRRLPDVLAGVVSAAPVVSPDRLRPDLPAGLVALCRRCLAKTPVDRYATVQEVAAALANLINEGA